MKEYSESGSEYISQNKYFNDYNSLSFDTREKDPESCLKLHEFLCVRVLMCGV